MGAAQGRAAERGARHVGARQGWGAPRGSSSKGAGGAVLSLLLASRGGVAFSRGRTTCFLWRIPSCSLED